MKKINNKNKFKKYKNNNIMARHPQNQLLMLSKNSKKQNV